MTDIDPKAVDDHLTSIIGTIAEGLTDEELSELIQRVPEQAMRMACSKLLRRIAAMNLPLRLEAERDGWRAVAKELLAVALGTSDFELPPIEIVQHPEAKRVGTPLLEQFWRDLTRKHEDLRRSKALTISAFRAAGPLLEGDPIIVRHDGRVAHAGIQTPHGHVAGIEPDGAIRVELTSHGESARRRWRQERR